jgi:hypothetical protein
MPFTLTNLTGSICNVPYNAGDAGPTYTVWPGKSVEVSDEYLAGLSEDAQTRFVRVTSEPNPMFSVSVPYISVPVEDEGPFVTVTAPSFTSPVVVPPRRGRPPKAR